MASAKILVVAVLFVLGAQGSPPDRQNDVYYVGSDIDDIVNVPRSNVNVGVGSNTGSGLVDVGVGSPHSRVNVGVGSNTGSGLVDVGVRSPHSKVNVGVGSGSSSGLVDVGVRYPHSKVNVGVGSNSGSGLVDVGVRSPSSRVNVGVGSGSSSGLVDVGVRSSHSKVNVGVGSNSGSGLVDVGVRSPNSRVNVGVGSGVGVQVYGRRPTVGVQKPIKPVDVDVDTVDAYYPSSGVDVGVFPPLVDVKVASDDVPIKIGGDVVKRRPVDLRINIPNIFHLDLGNSNNGERRLGISAPFFRFDLNRPLFGIRQ